MGKKKARINWRDHLINFFGVVIGVSIAFYLSNWKEGRDRKRQEKEYLNSMLNDLESDIAYLNESADTLTYYHALAEKLTRQLMARRVNLDSLDEMIQSFYAYVPFAAQDNTYQSLVASANLEYITNFELRKEIIELYHQHYGAIRILAENSARQQSELVLPYVIHNFSFTSDMAPRKAMVRSTTFANIAFMVHYVLEERQKYDSIALKEAQNLKRLIEQEIADR